VFIHARNPPYASAMKKRDQIRSICNILLYRFLNNIVTITTESVQYATKRSNVFVLMIFVKAKFSCPNTQSKYLYAKSDPTMTMTSPNTLRVIPILIFFCEKIVFMIRIRTYTNKMLVTIGRTKCTMVDKILKD